MEQQRANVASFYDQIAPVYDQALEAQVESRISLLLQETYAKVGITGGTVLDIGCGTGTLKNYLGDTFTYKGIDLSMNMLHRAEARGFETLHGPVEVVLERLDDQSVDHVVAVSSLYFIKNIEEVFHHVERVARKTFFASLEQFQPKVIQAMSEKGIKLYNHSASAVPDPKEVVSNIFLWKRPSTGDEIYGDIVFKQF